MLATNKRLTACPMIFDPMSSLNVGRATGSHPVIEQIVFDCDDIVRLQVRTLHESHK